MAWLYLQEYHFPLPFTRRWSARRLALVHVSGNHVSINHFSISESRLDPGEKFEERKKKSVPTNFTNLRIYDWIYYAVELDIF